jgi:hypothetical protein
MKYIITESQHKRLFEEEQKVLHIPDIKLFGNDWDILQRFLESKGNPLYSIGGDLFLFLTPIKSLGNLTSVGGDVELRGTGIESFGNLTSVGGNLDLEGTMIESFENLTYVGGYLDLENTPISEKYSEKEIRQMVNIGGHIYKKL